MCNNLLQNQALKTQRVIKSQFEQLHQVLYHEESVRLAAVKKEEEEKTARMKDKFKELAAEVLSLSETIAVIQEKLKEDEMVLLKVCTVQFYHFLNRNFQKCAHLTEILLFFLFLEFQSYSGQVC